VLALPLDYRHPHGRTIDVTISRIATAKPASRRGILLSNPGGPGGSGLYLPTVLAQLMPAQVTDAYDLIGFDPRGVGASTPISCDLGANVDGTLALPYPAPDGSIARNIAFARATSASCAARSGALMPYITTANTARDMDRIRAALGEPKLSYLGVSYGTYLGGVYTSLFPSHSDRIVLDSSVDPSIVWYDMWRTWNSAVAIRLPDFTAWVAARDATYHLGATSQAARDTFFRLTSALDQKPLQLPTVLVDGNLLREVTRSLLYADAAFPELATDWQTLAQAIGSGASAHTQALQRAFARPAPQARPFLSAATPPDNGLAVLYSIVCDDAAWPRDLGVYERNVATARPLWPITAGMPSNVWPCAFWPFRPLEPVVRVNDRGPRDVLMLQNTRDPATSLRSALGMRAALGRRAAMVTVDEGGHGVYGLGSCADNLANTFFATGALPGTDLSCPAPAASPQLSPSKAAAAALWRQAIRAASPGA
jgi:pimeloyl-ACP methyl ester carboxylesterase